MIFLADAIERVGQVQFGNAWNGKEFEAFRRLRPFHDFRQTLADFSSELAAWADKQSKKEILAGDLSKHTADPIGAGYQRAYDEAVEKWREYKEANTRALERLEWALDWVIKSAAQGRLETYHRKVDTVFSPGTYRPAPEGFWNVEDATRNRICDGSLEYISTDHTSNQSCQDDLEAIYIFFSRENFEHQLTAMGQVVELKAEHGDLYLSAYMRLAIAVIQDQKLSFAQQCKKELVEEAAHRLAPQYGIDPSDQKTLISYLATIVREPKSKKGRNPN